MNGIDSENGNAKNQGNRDTRRIMHRGFSVADTHRDETNHLLGQGLPIASRNANIDQIIDLTKNRCSSDTSLGIYDHLRRQCMWRPMVAGLGIAGGRRCISLERLDGGMDADDELRFNKAWVSFIDELHFTNQWNLKNVITNSSIDEKRRRLSALRGSFTSSSSSASSSCSSLSDEVANVQMAKETVRKVVRFADVNGLELVSIRYFQRSSESILNFESNNECNLQQHNQQQPRDTYSRDGICRTKAELYTHLSPYIYVSATNAVNTSSNTFDRGQLTATRTTTLNGRSIFQASTPHDSNYTSITSSLHHRPLVATFQMPRFLPNFQSLLMSQNVVLESVAAFGQSVSGTVAVKELGHFEKEVFIRESHNDWQSFRDHKAKYIPDSFDGTSSRFSFMIIIHEISSRQQQRNSNRSNSITSLQFAVCYTTGNQVYWDNHYNRNYVFLIPFAPDMHVNVPTVKRPLSRR